MTPEEAAYHRLMLVAGLGEKYDQALDRTLEEENPLTDLTLELASCMSDRTKTISVLYDYTLGHPVDDRKVCDLVLADVRERYFEEDLSQKAVASLLYGIVQNADIRDMEPWEDLAYLSEAQDCYENHLISPQVFFAAFSAFLLRGERLDVWELQRDLQCMQGKTGKSAAFRCNTILCVFCAAMSFAWIFTAAALTGWRDLGEFTRRDWLIWGICMVLELLIILLEAFFGSRAGKAYWGQRWAVRRRILERFKTAGLKAYSSYERVCYEYSDACRGVIFPKDGGYTVMLESFSFDTLVWHLDAHKEGLNSLAEAEAYLREELGFDSEDELTK